MSSMILSGDTSGAITVTVPAVAGTNTITLPAATGTVQVSGNQPAFSYYQSTLQSITGGANTKLTFTTSEFDTTGGMYASSRFTPTVAGYYQINAAFSQGGLQQTVAIVFKNGSAYKSGVNGQNYNAMVSALVYCNGSTDYIEIYAYSATTQNTNTGANLTYFQACMVRSA